MNKMIEKIGTDKILHFCLGGFITALITLVAMLQEYGHISLGTICAIPTIGTIVVFMISVFKEAMIDDKFDWKDILAAMLGCVLVYIATILGVLFNIGSY